MNHLIRGYGALVASLAIVACAPLPNDNELLEGPIEGLTPTQMHNFVLGDNEFSRMVTPAEGLGPRFNAPSCESCHPGDGVGHPSTMFIRFGRLDENGFDPLLAFGGPQLQDRAIPGVSPEQIPEQANVQTGMIGNAVTGLGLLEAVDDTTILALADPDDLDGDGISGRPNWITPTDHIEAMAARDRLMTPQATRFELHDGKYLGRFGRKANTISLLHQVVSALSQDMGLTSTFAPDQLQTPEDAGFPIGEGSRIEVSQNTLNTLTFYMKTLRAPERRNADNPTVLRGEALFSSTGCTSCHVDSLTTGASVIQPLDRVTFYPYTDLLLHDMGPELDDGYSEGIAEGGEWRTTPLWGFGLREDAQGGRMFLLHDGRARSIDEAIEYHGGEASASRARYRALANDDRAALTRFLMSL